MSERKNSLCVGIDILRRLKDGRSNSVSHKCTKQWADVHKVSPKTIILHDIHMLEVVKFEVISTEDLIQLGERIIRINLGKKL
jgi:hypothetical protein